MTPAEHLAAALRALGLDGDPEMAETPKRLAELLAEFRGEADPPALSCFDAHGHEPIVLRDLPFHSLCAHHLLPFFGTATVAYRPEAKIAGFGGVARLLEHHARRPQLQERLAADLANDLRVALDARAVVVKVTARQLCMEMRGARSPGEIVVYARRGAEDPVLRGLVG